MVKQETRAVFVSEDGEVFDKEEDAHAHEALIAKRRNELSSLKVYRVSHGFDSTEGRGYFKKTLVLSDEPRSVVIQWCIDRFGEPLDAWYGAGFYSRWELDECASDTVDWAIEFNGYSGHYGESPWELAVVSKLDFEFAGLPVSEFPWPRPRKS